MNDIIFKQFINSVKNELINEIELKIIDFYAQVHLTVEQRVDFRYQIWVHLNKYALSMVDCELRSRYVD